jgi:hypothetical protein
LPPNDKRNSPAGPPGSASSANRENYRFLLYFRMSTATAATMMIPLTTCCQ